MSRTRNAFRNILWGTIQKIVLLFMPFLIRTVIIKVLGADYIGLSSLFASILGLLSLAELGVSNAIISSMYKPIVNNDTKTICALLAFFRKAYHLIGAVISVIGLCILPFLDGLIKGDVPADVNIRLLYLIYLFNTAVSYFMFSYKSCLFVAHQRGDINSKILTLLSLSQYLLQITLLLLFRNYYCYVIIIPLITIANNIVVAITARKYYPQYICTGKLNRVIRSDIKQRVTGLMLAKVSATIRSSIDSLFISTMLGLTITAMYSNYFHIVTAVAGLIQVLEGSIIAGVGNSLATESKEKNYNDFLKFTFMLQWIVGICSIMILCIEQPFMYIWVGKELMFKDAMVVLCAIYLYVNCISLIRGVYTQALGMWWSLRYVSFVDIFINTTLNFVLGKLLGAYGILLATIVDMALVSIPWTTYYLFRDYFGISLLHKYFLQYIKYFLAAIIVGTICYTILLPLNSLSTYISVLLKLLSGLILSNVMYYLVFKRNKYFADFVSMLTRMLERIPPLDHILH